MKYLVGMLMKIFVCILLFTIVTAKSLTNNNKYIIVLRNGSTQGDLMFVMNEIQMSEERESEEMEIQFSKFIFPFVTAILSDTTVQKISLLPIVDYIEKDQPVYMCPIPVNYNTSKWHNPGLQASTDRYNLDILNKPAHGCQDDQYTPPNGGTGADIYILDTGINYDHADLKNANGETRAFYSGYDAINPSTDGWDCNGHGSHCAGIAGGLTSGVAKDANLYSVRVLGCSGSGSLTGIMNALDYVVGLHHDNKNNPDFVASIASLSLGAGFSQTFNNAVNDAVAQGLIVVIASGNDGWDACSTSPGSAEDAITVGGSSAPMPGTNGCSNPIAYFSNWGTCVDVIAPGVNIMSIDYNNNYGFTPLSGTSMACPHVAGAAALKMKQDTTQTPAQVKEWMQNGVDDVDRSSMPQSARAVSHSKRLRVPTTFN